MSGTSAVSEATSEGKMLAISMPPTLPHLLSRLDALHPLSMLPPDHVPSLNPLSPGKKPKLSLDTSDLASTFHGSVSRQTSFKPDTTATPTTLNTFNNTFDLSYRPSPVSTLPSPVPSLARRQSAHPSSPIGRTSDQPYNFTLPFGIHPILKNSPLPRDVRRPSISASPRISGRRVFFPPPKKVTFRAELAEEIVTQKYVMRHADLSSSEDDYSSSETDEQSSTSNDEEVEEGKEQAIRVDEISARGRRKRKCTATSPCPPNEDNRGREDTSQSRSTRRSKRKRRIWVWTEPTVPNEPNLQGNRVDGDTENKRSTESQDSSLATIAAQVPERSEQADQSNEAKNV